MASSGEGLVGFCGRPPYCDPRSQTDGPCPGGASAAVVRRSVVWKRNVLRVYFQNSEVLKVWGLKEETIIKWAKAWREVMLFEETTNIRRADIRVEFSETGGNWSVVGMCAAKVRGSDPTMMLNLNKKEFPSEKEQRSLVIHEFGHALGLEHEHQRSDFWDVMEKHINLDRMKEDKRVKDPIADEGIASFGAGWFEKKEGIVSAIRSFLGIRKKSNDDVGSPYDSDSIMHYAFDVDWLIEKNHRDIRKLSEIPKEERVYFNGIHKRRNRLAEDPSETDISCLRKAYEM